ncbi:uncharacterized protein [Pyxicephalus adspersus]|uniref:uncharacterized protein isoform X2 n=1 Tax=Pyxicephalus adspersus TaxID=30357 RepID=UPI003B5991FB
MENQPPLILSDGTISRNTPERCPRPLYSRDSTQQLHQIPHPYQGKNLIVKEEAEEMYVIGDDQWKEGIVHTEISTDGSSNINTPERCASPTYSRDYTQEHHNMSQDDQCWDFQPAAFSPNAGPSGTARPMRGRTQRGNQPSRKQNLTWTALENSVLVSNTLPHYPELCGTHTRLLYPYQRKQIWQQIAVAVNAVSRQHRDWKHCRKKLTDIRRAIVRKHREHHNARSGGVPPKEIILVEYEKELMTVLKDELISGLGGDYDTDLPVLYFPEHEEEAEEEQKLGMSHGDKLAQEGGAPRPEEPLTLHSEAVKSEMSPASSLLWAGPSSLPRRHQPVSPLVHSPSAVTPEASTIPVAFSPKPEKEKATPSPTGDSSSSQPYMQQQLELQRQQLLAHRRTHRVMEVQVRQQRRHYMAVERALNALVQQQRNLTHEMAGIHSVLRQAVTVMGESSLQFKAGEKQQQEEQVNSSSPARAANNRRGRPRGVNRNSLC